MICMLKKKNIYPAYISKQLKLWKTSYSYNDSKWRRLTLLCSKKLSVLLIRLTTKHHSDFYLSQMPSFFLQKKNKHESHKKVYENKYFFKVVMLSEDTKI